MALELAGTSSSVVAALFPLLVLKCKRIKFSASAFLSSSFILVFSCLFRKRIFKNQMALSLMDPFGRRQQASRQQIVFIANLA
jgi:hypothetical protein